MEQWSQHIQTTASACYIPGTHLAVDECMVRFQGRCKDKTTIPTKPIPTGFRIWLLAQDGYFLRWLWHAPITCKGPVGIPVHKDKQFYDSKDKKLHITPTQAVVSLLNYP